MKNTAESTESTESPIQLAEVSWMKKAFSFPEAAVNTATAKHAQEEVRVGHNGTKCANFLGKKEYSMLGQHVKLFRSPTLLARAISFVVSDSRQLASIVESLQTRDGENLKKAALENWFVQPETSTRFLAQLSEKMGKDGDVGNLFAEMIESNISAICSRLKSAFPCRDKILTEAFALHDEGRYLASIPLMLTNAEGIALNVSGKSIFTPGAWAKGGKPAKIAPWIDRLEISHLAKIYLSVLQTEHPMSRGGKNGGLSRHLVLHGKVVNYGNRAFALQAISILGFVGWAFSADGLITELTSHNNVR